jgi:hypothetical protein
MASSGSFSKGYKATKGQFLIWHIYVVMMKRKKDLKL